MKKNLILTLVSFCVLYLMSCTKKELTSEVSNSLEKDQIAAGPNGFEISYWIDIDVSANNGRGYWFNYNTKPSNPAPLNHQIWAAISRCRYSYHATSLYVIYHRQFEIEKAKDIFRLWKQFGDQMGVKIIPTFVLEDYATKEINCRTVNNKRICDTVNDFKLNFIASELQALSNWCKLTINSTDIAVYDIYRDRQQATSQQSPLLSVMQGAFGKIIRVGSQPSYPGNPSEYLNPNIFKRAVQDTWSAECEGRTNESWNGPGTIPGDVELYGKIKLEKWVSDRQNDSPTIPITWCLIPVAWDYDEILDPHGYKFPGDDALTNDPPKAGRISLCHSAIVNAYSGGSSHPLFGGYSCDLHILNANSAGRQEGNQSFYNRIKSDQLYTGYFASGINQVAAVYDLYDN